MTDSSIEGICWPLLTDVETHPIPALLEKLKITEFSSNKRLIEGQLHQLNRLHSWFFAQSAFYRHRLKQSGFTMAHELNLDNFQTIPLLTRRELQSANTVFCQPPPSHFPVAMTQTSGSSGEPVVVNRTMVCQLFWMAFTMREHIWWQRDLSGILVSIRPFIKQDFLSLPNWGPPASLLTKTGPGYALSSTLKIESQVKILQQINPHYMTSFPTNLNALLQLIEEKKITLSNLKQVRCMGETLHPDIRNRAEKILNVPVIDCYSSQELGPIAVQCPVSGLYHIMAENLIVEVLNEQNNPCKVGEIGQLVITDLHNFATPLIRYAIGDYAEVAGSCKCGRQLPTLKRIMGRSRNMVIFPDKSKYWPLVGFAQYRKIAPIIQYQLIQRSLYDIDALFVVERNLSPKEEELLTKVIQDSLGYAFNINFCYYKNKIPVGKNGKFEEFVCEVLN